MTNLETMYMGIPLRNPIIAGASAWTSSVDSILRLEQAGVAAVVTKSLFEEQIQLERFKFDEDQEKYNCRHADMITVFPKLEYAGPQEHLVWVGKAKAAARIPVIASLNAVTPDTWIEYAQRLAGTGVDGLECNLFATPRDSRRTGADIEEEQVRLVAGLKSAVSIPVSVKLSPFYTNPGNVIRRMADAGADAVVIFNRLIEPDFDIVTGRSIAPFNLSFDTDYRLPLRHIGLVEGEIDADLCGSTGVFGGDEVIKMLLAGASAVQIASSLFRHGPARIAVMLKDLETWMAAKGCLTLGDFKGKLSRDVRSLGLFAGPVCTTASEPR